MKRFAISLAAACAVALMPRVGSTFDLFTVHEPVFAMVAGVLFAGEAVGHWDRTGTVAVHSSLDATQACAGTFRYTGAKSGEVRLACSDGSDVALTFSALDLLSGWGQGPTARGPVRFTFGLSPEAAMPYLEVPAGKRIVVTEHGPTLQER
jgi:hypothetical protein